MIHRRLIIPLLLLVLAVPASGVVLYPLPDEPLQKAAEQLKSRNFRSAHDLALTAKPGGQRDFLTGYAAYRAGSWQEAADLLNQSGASFPLLGDYALYYRTDALLRMGQLDDALAAIQSFSKNYPDSILTRQAELLNADILAARKELRPAVAAYLAFAEKYVTGADAVSALFRAASCREQLNETDGAGALYRSIWLKYPTSPLAGQAADRLTALAAPGGAPPLSYPRDDLFRRATLLADLRQNNDALTALDAIPPGAADDPLTARILLKKGQLLFKVRKYQEAAELLARLAPAIPAKEQDDCLYWLARSQDRTGKDDDAVRTFLSLADTFPRSDLADDALLQAALIRKDQGNREQTVTLLERLLAGYPQSENRARALWELGWGRYQIKEYPAAAEQFKALATIPEFREKALYWQGRSLEATGSTEAAGAVFATLYREYPNGFYAVRYIKLTEPRDRVTSSPDFQQTIPLPSGYERIKALITFGMYDEARRELSDDRKKGGRTGNSVATARFYLEMGDYTTPVSFVKPDKLMAITPENLRLWNLSYPLPYREPVKTQASHTGLPESLVYGLMRAESAFSPTIISPAGAVGLMQLMPATARQVSGKGKAFNVADLSRPDVNISCGVRHLKDLTIQYDNSLVLSIAAYNAGAVPVNRWRTKFGALREDEFIENIPYAETREYVKKVLAGAELYNRLYNLGPALLPAVRDAGRSKPATPPTVPVTTGGERFANLSTLPPTPGAPL